MSDLRVEMHGELIGRLVSRRGTFDFVSDGGAVRSHGFGSQVMSLAVPLVPFPQERDAGLRRNFFSELLPEGPARERLANQANVSSNDVIGMLRVYGRDIAGALQIWDPSEPGEPRVPRLERLDEAGVARMLREATTSPLGNKPRGGKTSLNGVQNKIVLVHTDDGWARALDGYPSTHIVKPMVPAYPTMIFDEEYGSRFARGLGLAGFDTHLDSFDDVSAVVIARYDRDANSTDGRIHQEDFNQILGLSGEQKYETYGGAPLGALARVLSPEDKAKLLMMTTISVALGNLDNHAKNVSLLHFPNGSTELAPMYDVVPQTHLPGTDDELAFAVDGVFEQRRISRDGLVAEGESWGLRSADKIVGDALAEIGRIATLERPHPAAHPGLQHVVESFAENLLSGRAAGDDGESVAQPSVPSSDIGGWAWANAVQGHRKGEGLGGTYAGGNEGSFATKPNSAPEARLEDD